MFRGLFLLMLMGFTLRAEQCLVIGDSLTKEYEAEFPGLYPNNPASWQARNWVEILHQHRTDWFDLGTWSVYPDPRLTGHRFNWAFPGATTTDIRNQLSSIYNFWWTNTLKGQLRTDVQRVVIFAGGNDADSYYANLYNGTVDASVTNTTLGNLQWIINYVRTVNATVPIVLVSVPHVGCTPKIQLGYPTDPVKTGRVTAAMDALNATLASYAQSQNIGFVLGVYDFTKSLITQPFRIKGIEFYRVADADARTRYTFSGDGFHPNTCAHTKIAQMVVDAFNAKYPSTAINPLTDDYIISTVLGLDPNIPFTEWLASQGQNGSFTADSNLNGIPNGVEFALEGVTDASSMPIPVMLQGNALTLTYRPRAVFTEWGSIQAQSSPDLINWTDIGPTQTMTNPDGTVTISVNLAGKGFVRLKCSPPP
ncbi:SGNH/GDSL hydrolase family protein [Prosthecobacter sp.]|jgi:lysophospholipase L1-like esterase|uniref:SGNH/GDSL hydrolase family protein n=1 Tax=Prosthecobacter sp. TaxID=1965333 RepID=UPI0037CA2CDD